MIFILKLLKLLTSVSKKEEALKEIGNELSEVGLCTVEKIYKKYIVKINNFWALEDDEMAKQNIPPKMRECIRENIIDFVKNINIDDVAKKCKYDELLLGNVLADEYRRLYEQDAESQYIYCQRALYSISNNAVELIKNSDNFEREIILECYRILFEIQEKSIENEKWRTEIVEQLKELVRKDKITFEQFIYGLPEKVISNSPFHYLCSDIDIYGRDYELRLLDNFINAPDKLLFWSILGPGGIGKSKLAYYFLQNHKEDRDWKMTFITSHNLKEILLLSNWECSKNLLLVIDYAGAVAEELGNWIQRMAINIENRKHKVRLLLLERQGFRKVESLYLDEEEYVAPEWYNKLCRPISEGLFANKEKIKEYQYLYNKYPCMLTLKSLESNAHINIMDDYAAAIKKPILSDDVKREILQFVEEKLPPIKQENFKVTPLYVLFVTDAALNGKNFRNWNLEKLMEDVYERDDKIWKKCIYEEDLLFALKELLIYITIVKEWEFGTTVPEPLMESEHVVSEYRMKEINDPAYDWIYILTGRLNNKNYVPVMGALEPDLVGEYYVLKHFESYNDVTLQQWSRMLLKNTLSCREFFGRCIQDYGKVYYLVFLKVFSSMNIVLEEVDENELAEQIKTVAFLWYQYYQNVLPVCMIEPKKQIRKFCERWRTYSQDAAELYTIVFVKKVEIRGSQKKEKYRILEQLHSKWEGSIIITEAYIELLAILVEYYYGSGFYDKGNEYVKLLQAIIDKWGTYNEDIAICCANALGRIIPLQYEAGSKAQGMINIAVLNDLLNNWENENFALYFIVVQGDMAIAQSGMNEQKECEQTLIILCETVKRWGATSERIAWRAIDTMTKVFIRLHNKIQESTRMDLIKTLEVLVQECSGLSEGIIWHCAKAFDRILNIRTITPKEFEFIMLVQKDCYNKLRW